jgi:hypothetical protein
MLKLNAIQLLSMVLAVSAAVLMYLFREKNSYSSATKYMKAKRKAIFFQIGLLVLAMAIASFIIGTWIIPTYA